MLKGKRAICRTLSFLLRPKRGGGLLALGFRDPKPPISDETTTSPLSCRCAAVALGLAWMAKVVQSHFCDLWCRQHPDEAPGWVRVVTHLTHPGHQPLTASFILYAYVSLVQRGSNDTIFPGQNLSFPILHPLHKTVFVFILIPCMLENDSCCYYFELVLYFSEQMCLSYLASVSWIFIFILFHSLTLVKTSGCFNCGWALLIMQEILVKKNLK